MQIFVKKLQGGECTIEVPPTTKIYDVKRQIAQKLNIPVEEQKLLFLGRTLADEQTILSYPNITDGTKLNLVVKKREGLYEVSIKYFKQLGMSDLESKCAADRLLKITQEKFNKLSWDDINRLALDCLMDEGVPRRSVGPVENDIEGDDVYSL